MYVSPFANVFSSISPSSTPRCSAIRAASSGCERPEKTISRFCGVSGIAWPVVIWVWGVPGSRPGSVCSIVALSTTAFLVHLTGTCDRERIGGHILRDHRAGCNPCVVADADRGDERIVDAGPDVAADGGAVLLRTSVAEIDGDVAGRDVGVLAHVGVAHVRQVWHLGAGADARVLDLHEGARFRPLLQLRAGA